MEVMLPNSIGSVSGNAWLKMDAVIIEAFAYRPTLVFREKFTMP